MLSHLSYLLVFFSLLRDQRIDFLMSLEYSGIDNSAFSAVIWNPILSVCRIDRRVPVRRLLVLIWRCSFFPDRLLGITAPVLANWLFLFAVFV